MIEAGTTMTHAEMSQGITREKLHTRRIDMDGYRRSDGLFEVRARLTDTKPHDFAPPAGDRTIAAGAAIHDVQVALVFDADLVIRAVETGMAAYPYVSCPGGGDTLQALVGLRIGAGWNSEVRKRLPACDTCTHMKEILGPMASAAYQTLTALRSHLVDQRDAAGHPVKIDSCHAYGASRALVERIWPAYHVPAPDGGRPDPGG
jgi:hypothetical protein